MNPWSVTGSSVCSGRDLRAGSVSLSWLAPRMPISGASLDTRSARSLSSRDALAPRMAPHASHRSGWPWPPVASDTGAPHCGHFCLSLTTCPLQEHESSLPPKARSERPHRSVVSYPSRRVQKRRSQPRSRMRTAARTAAHSRWSERNANVATTMLATGNRKRRSKAVGAVLPTLP